MSKYLREFTNHSAYTEYIEGSPLLPNVSVCINEGHVHFNKASELPPDNEIWYTTTSGGSISVLTSEMTGTYVGPTLISNTAPKDNNGKGVIKFAEPITKLGYIDTGLTQYYPIIGPIDMDNLLTSFTLPKSLTYLGYEAIPYCTEIENITLPDTITELWTYPNYHPELGDVACPFTMSRIYEGGTTPVGGLKSITTSKEMSTWQGGSIPRYDYMHITLGNGTEYKMVDFIVE